MKTVLELLEELYTLESPEAALGAPEESRTMTLEEALAHDQ